MPRPKKSADTTAPKAFTHDSSTRTGLPAGGTAGRAPLPKAPKKKYWYNPHLSPVLRHDPHRIIGQIALSLPRFGAHVQEARSAPQLRRS